MSPQAWRGIMLAGFLFCRGPSFCATRCFSRAASRLMATTVETMDPVQVSVPAAMAVHGQENVVFVDGSWFLQDGKRGIRSFEAGPRIPGALFFDINDICDKTSDLPHMMPPPSVFGAWADANHLSKETHVIVYGQANCPMHYRAWFTFRSMGHARSYIMAGSLQDWQEAGGPVDRDPKRVDSCIVSAAPKYKAVPSQYTVDKARVVASLETAALVDARSADRFFGRVDEPRPGLRLGHMPGAVNLPFVQVLDPNNVNKLLDSSQLVKVFEDAGDPLKTDQTVVISCGSGATACNVAAALLACGRDPDKTLVYDGSWAEWGADPKTPIVK